MRSKTSNWFECKVTYEQMQENGTQKKVKELYVVDALSFTEAETRIIKQMECLVSGAFEVSDIKKVSYREIFFADAGNKIAARETENLLKGCKEGPEAAEKAYEKPINWNSGDIDTGYFKVKINYITIDPKTAKEKMSPSYVLVEAVNMDNAKRNVDLAFQSCQMDFRIASITETKILDVYEYKIA